MNIYLMRHGETPWNKEKRIQGQQDILLNERGRQLARATKEGWKEPVFDYVFSSPLSRAYETAQILAGKGQEIITDRRLKEIGFGDAEGLSMRRARSDKENPIGRFFEHPDEYEPANGGESLDEVMARGMEFMEQVIVPLEKGCKNLLIVAHACIIRSIISGIEQIPTAEFWSGPPYKNCCVSLIECINGKMKVVEEARIYYEEREEENGRGYKLSI